MLATFKSLVQQRHFNDNFSKPDLIYFWYDTYLNLYLKLNHIFLLYFYIPNKFLTPYRTTWELPYPYFSSFILRSSFFIQFIHLFIKANHCKKAGWIKLAWWVLHGHIWFYWWSKSDGEKVASCNNLALVEKLINRK